MVERARITTLILIAMSVLSPPVFGEAPEAARGGGAAGAVTEFLEDFAGVVEGLDTYTFIMDSRVRKGLRRDNRISKFYFKKPNLIRTEVLKGRKRGSTVVLQKDGKIRGRNSFGLRLTLKPADRRLKNIRGSTFLNASFADKSARLNKQILEDGCAATLEEVEYDGRTAYHLRVLHKGAYDEVTEEGLWVDRESFLLLRNTMYAGKEVVSDVIWSDYEINVPLSDELFKL